MKTPARRRVRRHFPFDLGRQAAPGPAAPGIGLPPAHVHRRLVAEHPHGIAGPGLHDGAAGNTDLLDIARPPPALALQPLPACRIPELRMVVAAVADKLDYCARASSGLKARAAPGLLGAPVLAAFLQAESVHGQHGVGMLASLQDRATIWFISRCSWAIKTSGPLKGWFRKIRIAWPTS